MTEVLAVDPGKVTGVAHYADDLSLTDAFERPLLLALDACWSIIQARAVVVVVERFHITAATLRTGRDHTALDGIGALRWMAAFCDRSFVLQTAGDVKALITKARLEKLGMRHPTPGDHTDDACRHLAYYLARLGELKLPA